MGEGLDFEGGDGNRRWTAEEEAECVSVPGGGRLNRMWLLWVSTSPLPTPTPHLTPGGGDGGNKDVVLFGPRWF